MASTDEKVILNGREVSPPPAFALERKTSADVAKILARSHDADEAMKAFTTGEIIEVDEATNKRLLRIINWHLMPIMCVVYGINYLDKTTISYTSIMGLSTYIDAVGPTQVKQLIQPMDHCQTRTYRSAKAPSEAALAQRQNHRAALEPSSGCYHSRSTLQIQLR